MQNEKHLHNCTQDSMPQHLTDKTTARLFTRFGSMYGHLFTSRWPDERAAIAARQEWAVQLAEFDTDTLGKALKLCLKRFPMPPTLPEFYQLCRELTKSPRAMHRMHEPLRLDAPRCSKEQAKENCADLKKMIAAAGLVV